MPMSCTELADRSGVFAHERAARAAASSSLRKARPLSLLCAFPAPGSLRIPFDNVLLTALTCERTFHDSAVKTALSRRVCSPGARGMTWTRRSPSGGPCGESERRFVPR